MKLMRTVQLSALGALALSIMLHAAPTAAVADAAMQGNRDAVRVLLKQAADVNAAQGDGMTALHWAAMHGDASLAGSTVAKASGRLVERGSIRTFAPGK
jgi:hypothetical protein